MSRKKLEISDFTQMAADIWFGQGLHFAGMEYRKGMGFSDVQHAVIKARKFGMGKTEHELDLMAVYLHGIFKAAT